MSRRMIVVTGGAGFIGSNIVARLAAEDRFDIVIDDEDVDGEIFETFGALAAFVTEKLNARS